jgi:hypothetical protein
MKGAAHSAATVVIDLYGFDVEWKIHFSILSTCFVFSVISESLFLDYWALADSLGWKL